MHNNPNDMWRVWKTTFNILVEIHAALRTRRIRSSKLSWIKPELKWQEKDLLKIKAIPSKDIYFDLNIITSCLHEVV